MEARATVAAAALALALSSCSVFDGGSQATEDPSGAVSTVTVSPTAGKPATDVVQVDPIDADGDVLDTYDVDDPADGDYRQAARDCSDPSAYSTSPGTYACASEALAADACWLDGTGPSLLCIYDPWDQSLQRIPLDQRPGATEAPETPEPLAVETDDGSRYRARNTAGNSTREDLSDAYDCEEGPCRNGDAPPYVLVKEGERWVDQRADVWTVRVGGNSGQPKRVDVVRAWFIAAG